MTAKKLMVTDVTLREFAARRDGSLSFRESLETAKGLERLHLDVIALPAIVNVKADTLLCRTIASAVRESTLSLTVGYTEESVVAAWNAISGASHPQLCVSLPVSTVQMEYICHKKGPKMLAAVNSLVRASRALCDNVMFMAEDATRSEPEFLVQAVQTAVEAGATAIGIRDCEGTMMPEEFGALVEKLIHAVPALETIPLTVQCADDLSLATAATFAAIKAGASGVAVTAFGVTAPSPSSVARIAAIQTAQLGVTCSLGVTELQRGLQRLHQVIGARRSATSPFENGVQEEESSLCITADTTRSTVDAAVRELGYELNEEDLARVFEECGRVAEKKTVGARELEAIIAAEAMQVPPTYKLISFVINSGNQISATAHVRFERDGKTVEGVSLGDGPIDAAFLAIEQIVGRHYELDDFQIQSVTQGREAVGSALVKLREGGRLYSGNGISTDIIGASIRAYVNALNKIAYEQTV